MNYFKLLFFYLINIFDSLINFVCAIFRYYPSLEWAQDFLLAKELKRIEGEIDGRTEDRISALEKADALMEAAKTFDEPKEPE